MIAKTLESFTGELNNLINANVAIKYYDGTGILPDKTVTAILDNSCYQVESHEFDFYNLTKMLDALNLHYYNRYKEMHTLYFSYFLAWLKEIVILSSFKRDTITVIRRV